MERDLCADVRTEEGYMRVSVEYSCDDSRAKILDAITDMEREFKIYPSVLRRAINDHAGNVSVEFDAGGNCERRDAGKFIEALLNKLDLKACNPY
jgi:hypothetical protein